MVSELATNCIRHTTTSFTVEAEWTGPTIRVDVTDDGGGAPVLQPPDPGNLGGRGLRIVDALSTDWGVIDTPTAPGKTVWFSVRADALALGPQVQVGSAGV